MLNVKLTGLKVPILPPILSAAWTSHSVHVFQAQISALLALLVVKNKNASRMDLK